MFFSTPAATEPYKANVFRTGPLNDRLQGIALADFVLDELKGRDERHHPLGAAGRQ